MRKSRERYRAAKIAAEENHVAELASMKAATEAAEKELAVAQAELLFYERAIEKLDAGSKTLCDLLGEESP